jgi:integrase
LLKTLPRIDAHVFTSGAGAYSSTHPDHLHKQVRDKLKLSSEFVIHSLRHTLGTRLGESGADAFTIMKLMGHSSIVVSQRYVHPSTDAMKRAISGMELGIVGAKGLTAETENASKPLADKGMGA